MYSTFEEKCVLEKVRDDQKTVMRRDGRLHADEGKVISESSREGSAS